jgi:2-polyprenyl-3-methyl-5-hydroxy-6-metoxy-1,4-benzoquinol methylase
MKDTPTADAVGHFSENVAAFHEYYRNNPEFHERLEVWRALLDRYALRDGVSLDMGCGSGVFTFYLADKGGTVVGVDGAPDMIAFCEEQRVKRGVTNARFVAGRLPAIDEQAFPKADLLISSSVIEYVPEFEDVLSLFARLLKPQSVLIVSMPNRLCINRGYERLKYLLTGSPQIYRYILHFTTPSSLEQRLRRYGFKLTDVRFYNHATRLARLTRSLRLPETLTEDLFVAVFRRTAA